MSPCAAVVPLLLLMEQILLKREKSSTHSIDNLLPNKDVLWKGLVMLKSLPAHSSARMSVAFGTSYHHTLTSEHSTHGTYAPTSRTRADRGHAARDVFAGASE